MRMLGITEVRRFDIFKDVMKKHTTQGPDEGKEVDILQMSTRRIAANEKSPHSEYVGNWYTAKRKEAENKLEALQGIVASQNGNR